MNDFYIYIHRKATNGAVFYVGKGCGNRAWSKDRRNKHWLSIVAKHGYVVDVIESGYQSWYAYEREIEVIAKHKELGCKLANKTAGGDGVVGYEYTDEHRAKIAANSKSAWATKSYREKVLQSLEGVAKRNWQRPEYREKTVAAIRAAAATNEALKKRSEANFRSWADPETRRRRIEGIVSVKATPESKARMSKAQKARWVVDGAREKLRESKRETMRRILCVETGVVFDAIKSAARWIDSLGFSGVSRGNIRSVCDKPTRTAYGYHWQSVEVS